MRFVTAAVVITLMMTSGSLSERRGAPLERTASEPALRELRSSGNSLFRKREYLLASEVYASGYQTAIRTGDRSSALRFLNNLAGCQFAMFRYREALKAYLEARRLARALNDTEMVAAVSTNLSSLYLLVEEPGAGIEAAREGLVLLRDLGHSKYLPLLLTQNALLHARTGDMTSAWGLFSEAMAEAARADDIAVLAGSYNQFGYLLLRRGDVAVAAPLLEEAFRLSKLYKLPELDYSYYTVGRLRLMQGDLKAAARLLDDAVDRASRGTGTLAAWRVLQERGRTRLLQGRLEEALVDFRSALEHVQRWRAELPSADSVWTNTTADVQSVYESYIQAAAHLYFRTGRQRYARLAFCATEENRAVGLRSLISTAEGRDQRLPPEYWQILAQVRAAEAELLQVDDSDKRASLSRLRYRLTEIESTFGLEGIQAGAIEPGSVNRYIRALGSDEALLSFHLGETDSYRWALTHEGFEMRRLPDRGQLAEMVRKFSDSVHDDSGPGAGKRLYSAIFGGLRGPVLRKARWTLVLDQQLFDAPLAALTVDAPGRRREYLIASHTLEMLPAASMRRGAGGARRKGPFLGVGDAVYNTADPRWTGKDGHSRIAGLFRFVPALFASPVRMDRLELARLIGSGREVRQCARIWRNSPDGAVILEGADASRKRFVASLARKPSVIHFATHFLMSRSIPRQAMIALSLSQGGNTDILTPVEIGRLRLDGTVVVLSGCSSGEADVLPGEGLLGMSRAWLAAGAGAVVASRWPVPDDSGDLFTRFYHYLQKTGPDGSTPKAASALRDAQLDMLNSGTPKSSPRYWAAHFVAGKD